MQNDKHNKYDGRTEYLNELGTYAVGMLFLLVIFMAAYLVPGPAHSDLWKAPRVLWMHLGIR